VARERPKLEFFLPGVGIWNVNGGGQWTDGVKCLAGLRPARQYPPFVDDWNRSGKANVGVFGNGMWILDANGHAALDVGNGNAAFWLGNS
jgi:hypothetical protein